MTIRGMAWLALMTATGILSAGETLYGVYSAIVIDLRPNPVLTGLYCLLPVLCFPVFMLVRPARRSTALLLILAIGYVVAFSMLNWRTCAELGYCSDVAATVLETMKTTVVLAFFGVAIGRFVADLVDDQMTGRAPRR